MTASKKAQTGARISKKLRVNKQSLRDLSTTKDKAEAVRAGRAPKSVVDGSCGSGTKFC